MLAHRYDKHADKITFPCYAQPKLDGHRCLAMIDKKGKCTLWSRTRKPILSMPHIVRALEDSGLVNVTLDGELYNHAYREKFEILTSLIRASKPKEDCRMVGYHVYDYVHETVGFGVRATWLKDVMGRFLHTPVWPVETKLCPDPTEMVGMFHGYLVEGYEGLMARNLEGAYKHGRSYDLQKVKVMQDAEFEITGVKEGRGKLKGHGIFTCKTSAGTEFDVKMAGEIEKLLKYFELPREYIGQMLTVQYQDITGANGVPRFPVGLRLREGV